MEARALRITFLTPTDDLTGGNRVVATYADHLRQRGHTVLVVSNAPDRPSLRERVRALKRGHWLPIKSPAALPGHVALSGVPHKILDRPRPICESDLPDADVVIATWWQTAQWMASLPTRCGRKVHLIQGFEVWNGAHTEQDVHATLRLPNLKIAISNSLAREIEGVLGPLNIHVVPNAVDLERFDAPARDRGCPQTVGYIHARAAIKGSDIARAAINEARRHLPELRVLAFGTEAPDAQHPLPEGTEFHLRPSQQQIPQLYRRCDAWLFCSRRDSFGLPILEAMACRTPVVAVPIGAAPELLSSGGGQLVDTHEPDRIAVAVLELLQGSELEWRSASANAHRTAHGYGWRDATDRLLSTLETPA